MRVNRLFSDRMVLQRGKKIPIWGTGEKGERVTVRCLGHEAAGETGANGRWRVDLPPLPAGGPYEVTVESPRDRIVIREVLVGDVWLAGGQSNMQFPLRDSSGGEDEAASADCPEFRYFDVPRVERVEEAEREAGWRACSPDAAGDFSAVAYYFARSVQRSLRVPIGVVGCNMGATSAACWMPEHALAGDGELRIYLDEFAEAVRRFDPAAYEREEALFKEAVADYNRRLAQGLAGSELGGHPWPPPFHPNSFMRPCGLYSTMLAPTAPYALKGYLYYQGESDTHRPVLYEKLLSALIAEWRSLWGDGELPFLFVQLPGYDVAPSQRPGDGPARDSWPLLRESQAIVSERVPHAAMAVALDCGEGDDLHPKNKRPIGERLALLAMDRVYGMSVEGTGPEYRSMAIGNDGVELRFAHAEGGLTARDGELRGFEARDPSGDYLPVKAEADGARVILRLSAGMDPASIRYGWASAPDANLVNASGLPASPFRVSRPISRGKTSS